MVRRTKTYIAGDWTGDQRAIKQLYKWKDSKFWDLYFVDAHELTQARDTSMNCSIKKSLKERLDASKTFVLIVGKNTKNLRAGSCQYCSDYIPHVSKCKRGASASLLSYIEYECKQAAEAGIKIVVLYNFTSVNRNNCPDSVKYIGCHVAMIYRKNDGNLYWNYQAVKRALEQ